MSPLEISLIVFAVVFGGALVGIALRAVLPEHHLSPESRTVLTMSQGMVVTMAALVLGLLVASAQGSYETQRNELLEMSAKLVLLDHLLAHYGPEAKEVRGLLRGTVAEMIDRVWAKGSSTVTDVRSQPKSAKNEELYDRILELAPNDDSQRTLKMQALNTVLEIGRTRWLIYEQGSTSVSKPLLIVVVLWLCFILMSFGLFSPTNATVVSALLLTAISVSGAVFLILELYEPFHGLIQLSSAPLSNALAQLGR